MLKQKQFLNDGVDYVRFNLYSSKGDREGDYNPTDGTIQICLDNITEYVLDTYYTNVENILINQVIEKLTHEINHKWFTWASDLDLTNDQDGQVMKVINDWQEFDKKTSFT